MAYTGYEFCLSTEVVGSLDEFVVFPRHWFICQFSKAPMCSIYLKSWLYNFISQTVFRDRYLGYFTSSYKDLKQADCKLPVQRLFVYQVVPYSH